MQMTESIYVNAGFISTGICLVQSIFAAQLGMLEETIPDILPRELYALP